MRPSTADECDSAVTVDEWMGEVESAHRLSELFIHNIATYLIVASGFCGSKACSRRRRRGFSGSRGACIASKLCSRSGATFRQIPSPFRFS